MVSKTPSKLLNTWLSQNRSTLYPSAWSHSSRILSPGWSVCRQLYDHFLFKVHKIHNISPNRLLATKLETFYLSISQMPPQMPLCIRRVFPESSCYARQVFHPHPFPSPLKGEGFPCLSVCSRAVFHRTFDNVQKIM
jgi:hypothetical protein